MKNIIPYKNFYKLFESKIDPEIKRYLIDIFQELIDKGFNIVIYAEPGTGDIVLCVTKKNTYIYSEIIDYVDSAIDYMKSNNYRIAISKYEDNYYKMRSGTNWIYNLPAKNTITSVMNIHFRKNI